jgi:Sec-independent protein secretion pathway component TatC
MMTTHSSGVQVDFPQKINQEKEKRELNFLPFSLSLSFLGCSFSFFTRLP